FTEHGLRAVMKALFAGKVLVPVDTADKVGAALRMAFLMGQTYWQQADSEYISQHRKAGETMEKYNQLRSETVAMLAASQESCTECGLQKGVTTGPYCVSCGRTSNG
ncbi:MAG: hypothetical protein Q8L60_05665, partial [Gammaproteobacteria bacterium]|nr:hypothetical protein [Gammaproteobacteria bacterium]